MGTNAAVQVVNCRGVKLVTFYVQYDGYPKSLGQMIFDYFKESKIINGFNSKIHATPRYFNGAGCLAAWLVGSMKGNQIGNVYVVPDAILGGYDYFYRIQASDCQDILLTVHKGLKLLFDGELADFNPQAVKKGEFHV